MSKKSPKYLFSRKRRQANYKRSRRWSAENLESRRLLAGDAVQPMPDKDVSDPAMMSNENDDVHAMHDMSSHHSNHTLDPHPGDPARATEHTAAMNLAKPESASHRVAKSGQWSDSSIWHVSARPTENATIHIPQGVIVTVDTMDTNTYASLRIDGTLRFAPNVDTQLRVDTLVTSPTGRLEMGTTATPIQPDVSASIIVADRGEIDREFDPLGLGRGAILHGATVIHGSAKTSWTTAYNSPMAGDTTLTLASAPDGWMVGDSLVIAGTKMDATGDEVAKIAAVNGNSILLESPLREDHIPPAEDLHVHIANTSRNAYIRSESRDIARRGHVMFMHNPDAQIAYAGFYDLGRTDKSRLPNQSELDEDGRLIEGSGTNVAGRYSLHFHRHGVAANTPRVDVVGSAVVGSPGWGFVNHSSHVRFEDNVSYDVFGAAFYTEAGDEIGSFVNNLSIKTHGTGESPVSRGFEGEDLGHSGDGFWFQGGTGITVRGNVAAGATGSGLIVFGVEAITESVPEIPFLAENLPDPSFANGATTVPAGLTWLGEFANNTAYGSVVGLQTYYHRSPISTDFDGQAEQLLQYEFDFPNSLIEDATVWNAETGVLMNYNLDIHLRNIRVLNAPDQPGEFGMNVSNVYNLGEHVYEGLDIRGFEVGLIPSPNGRVIIESGAFANATDIDLVFPRQDHRQLDIRGDIEFVELPNTSEFDSSERLNIVASSDTRILVDASDEWFLYYDQITLNYGEFTGQQLFHPEQLAAIVPFDEQPEQVTPDDPGGEVPEQYLGLTNAEMQEQFGVSLAGVIATPDAIDAEGDGIVGLIGSPAVPPSTLIPQLLLGSDEEIAILKGELEETEEDEPEDEIDEGEDMEDGGEDELDNECHDDEEDENEDDSEDETDDEEEQEDPEFIDEEDLEGECHGEEEGEPEDEFEEEEEEGELEGDEEEHEEEDPEFLDDEELEDECHNDEEEELEDEFEGEEGEDEIEEEEPEEDPEFLDEDESDVECHDDEEEGEIDEEEGDELGDAGETEDDPDVLDEEELEDECGDEQDDPENDCGGDEGEMDEEEEEGEEEAHDEGEEGGEEIDDEGEEGGLPLPTTPMHAAVMALVRNDLTTNQVSTSGNWSDPAIWSNHTIPESGAHIVVPQGVTLTVDSVITDEINTLRVDGSLVFATDRDTELRVETLVSTATGRLEIGTANNSIQPNVTARVVFIDQGAIDRSSDPQQLGRGALLHGSTTIYGAETTHQLTLTEQPRAESTTLQLSRTPTGWNVGDRIVITGTQGATSDEVRSIAAISGQTISLDSPLELDHLPPKSDLSVHVANTTRNIVFTSENPEISRRGHVMFMHSNKVDVNYASFEQLGRTNKNEPLNDIFFEFTEDAVGNETSASIVFTASGGPATNIRGRYGIHFHRGGNDPSSQPANMNGSVVFDNPGWGFVNHSSHVNFINNVAYGVQGAAFYTEAGDEVGSMVGNIAIRSVSPTFTLDDSGAIDPDLRADVQDFGVDGDGFWLSGHRVSLVSNISAGATGHGMIIWSDGLVEADRGRTTVRVADIPNGHLIQDRDTIPAWWAPLADIQNNESYGATIGFRSRYVHSSVYLGEQGSEFHAPPSQAYLDTLRPVVDGLTVWGSRDGVLLNYNERMSIRNARLIGIGAPYVQNGGTADTGVGIDLYNEVSRGPGVIENVSIEGFNMGLLAPRHDQWRFTNLNLRNTTDMLITEPLMAPRVIDMTNVTFGDLSGTAVRSNASLRRNIVLEPGDDEGFQPYSFLMSDRITLDGRGIYANRQAADAVPLRNLPEEAIVSISSEFVGLTNRQLRDRYGTSVGGAIMPADARQVAFLAGGVIGSAATPATIYPPLYDMTNEGNPPIVVSSGNLRNFNAPQVTGTTISFEFPSEPNTQVETPALDGDVTNDGVVDATDIDTLSAAVARGAVDRVFDVDQDNQVGRQDVDYLINTVLRTTPGDANLDGVFDSSDLIAIFAAGKFELNESSNVSWSEGDWNGDGRFDTSDLIEAIRFFRFVGG